MAASETHTIPATRLHGTPAEPGELRADIQTDGPANKPGHAILKLATETTPKSGSRGLLIVGLYKLGKAIFFSVMGAAALHLIHQNFGDFVMSIVDRLPIDPEGHFVSLIMDRADLINHHQLRQFSMATFAYAALCLVEGYGLMRRRVWAEYFTTILTAMALPWEGYELVHHFSWYKVGVTLINLAVLFYLLWVLKQKRAQPESAAA
jgi:uncharacterized membrane protein (DUF2068 family)